MSVSKWEMKKIIPRSTVKEVYASIEADLIYASENLAAFSQRKSNKRSCIGTLGKAYLYQDNFAKAATTLESVITAGNYSLVAIHDFEEGENGAESVLKYNTLMLKELVLVVAM
jgi:hypothetical protein